MLLSRCVNFAPLQVHTVVGVIKILRTELLPVAHARTFGRNFVLGFGTARLQQQEHEFYRSYASFFEA